MSIFRSHDAGLDMLGATFSAAKRPVAPTARAPVAVTAARSPAVVPAVTPRAAALAAQTLAAVRQAAPIAQAASSAVRTVPTGTLAAPSYASMQQAAASMPAMRTVAAPAPSLASLVASPKGVTQAVTAKTGITAHDVATIKKASKTVDSSKKQVSKAAIAQAQAAAKHAAATAGKVAKRYPKVGSKLTSLSSVLKQKAAKATTVSGAVMTAQAATYQQFQVAEAALVESANEVNAVAQAGDIASVISAALPQLSGAPSVAQAGQAIVDRANAIVSNYDPNAGDPSVIGTVQQLQTDATAWQASAQAAGSSVNVATAGAKAGDPQVTAAIQGANAAGQHALASGQRLANALAMTGAPPTAPTQVPSPLPTDAASYSSMDPPTLAQAAQAAGQQATSAGAAGQSLASGTDATAWLQQAQAATNAANAAASTADQMYSAVAQNTSQAASGGGGGNGGGSGGGGGGSDGGGEGGGDGGDGGADSGGDEGGDYGAPPPDDSGDGGGGEELPERAMLEDDTVPDTDDLAEVPDAATDEMMGWDPFGAVSKFFSSPPPQSFYAEHEDDAAPLPVKQATRPSAFAAAQLAAARKHLAAEQALLRASQGDSVMGLEWSDEDDILVDQTDHEITDEEVDYERRRASVHRGAAYGYPEVYPPFGASSGQEGGDVMAMDETVNIFGHAYSRGRDFLGAGLPHQVRKPPPRAGYVAKTTPGGKTITALVTNTFHGGKPIDHKKSILNAKDVAKRAISVGQKLQHVLAHPATRLHGAVPVAHAHLTAAQLHQMASRLIGHGKGLHQRANSHAALVKANDMKTKAGVASVKAKTAVSSTNIHGLIEMDALHDDYDEVVRILGEEILGVHFFEPMTLEDDHYCSSEKLRQHILGAAAPDPSNPGYLTDGSPDPNYQTVPAPGDGTADPSTPSDGSKYGLGPPPTLADAKAARLANTSPDPHPDGNDMTIYHGLPLGAVVYTGVPPFGDMDVGSYNLFFGPPDGQTHHDWGIQPNQSADPNDHSKWTGGFLLHHDGWWYNWNSDNQRGSEGADKKQMGAGPHNWGPLIGDPTKQFRGLRYDIDGDQWFWYGDQAPEPATMNLDQQQLSQMLLDYKTQYTAAATDAAAQAAQDQLDAKSAADLAKQQTLEDAAHQRDMDKQAQAQELADRQAQAQQSAFDQQQAQQQAQLDLEAQRQQQQIETQQAQADIQTQQAQAQYALQHPDQAPPSGDGGGGGGGVYAATDAQAALEDDTVPDTDELADVQDAVEGQSEAEDEVVYGYDDELPDRDYTTTLRGSDKIRARRSHR